MNRSGLLMALACSVGAGASACSQRHDIAPAAVAADEVLEDQAEEASETAEQENAEENDEAAAAGSGRATGAESTAPATSGSSAPAQPPARARPPSTGGALAASTGGSAAISGSAGVGGDGGSSGSAGASGSAGLAAIGGSGGASASSTWPALDLTQLGPPQPLQTPMMFGLAEGPIWDPCGHQLLFVDVTASTIYALSPSDQLSTFARDTHNTNGIAFDVDGSLILAQMASPGHIARRAKDGTVTTIDPPGPRLHTPDDVTVRSDGTIYFSDGEFPPIGGVNLGALPVYAITPGASMLQNGGTVAGPNGVELSPDEKTLYVDAYFQGSVVKFDVAPDGTLKKGATLASGMTNPDSLCLDAAGNLYVAVSGGLDVLRPDGKRVGSIAIRTARGSTNCAFGGDDGKTLYVTAWTSVWKLSGMPIPGLQWQVDRRRLSCN